jgi:AraC family transcriptional regulator
VKNVLILLKTALAVVRIALTVRNLDMEKQVAVHPSEVLKEEWVQSRQSLWSNSLVVEHHLEPAGETETAVLTHHFIAVQLNECSPRQVSRFEGQEFDGSQYRGDFCLLPAGQSGFWHWESEDEAIISIANPLWLPQIAAETDALNPDKVELRSILSAHDPTLLSLALAFRQEMQQGEWGTQLYVESLANLFGVHLLRHYAVFQPKLCEQSGGLARWQLKQIQDYIQAHLDQDIKLADLAAVVNLSSYYFIKLFKQSTGMTPCQYLLQQRVQQAQELLAQQRQVAIADIALQCGFTNQSHFTKSFRRLVGTTPKVYRNRLR